MSKVIVDAASIHRDVVFIKVNVQDRKVSEWAAELGVKSIPTLLFYKDGKLCRGRIVGISCGVINEIEYILRNLKSICKDELNINDNLNMLGEYLMLCVSSIAYFKPCKSCGAACQL